VLRCRLHTAVRWEWDPVSRRTWVPSLTGLVALVLSAFTLVLVPEVGVALAGALLASSVVEAVVLVRLTGGAVARTTGTVAVGS
jgi:hypothetical protein